MYRIEKKLYPDGITISDEMVSTVEDVRKEIPNISSSQEEAVSSLLTGQEEVVVLPKDWEFFIVTRLEE